METIPKLAKAHSLYVANEYLRLGWALITEFRTEPDQEPYEYLFEWKQQSPPIYIDWEELSRRWGDESKKA
jgi:hypothetical protein